MRQKQIDQELQQSLQKAITQYGYVTEIKENCASLRQQMNQHLTSLLFKSEVNDRFDQKKAIADLIRHFEELVDWYFGEATLANVLANAAFNPRKPAEFYAHEMYRNIYAEFARLQPIVLSLWSNVTDPRLRFAEKYALYVISRFNTQFLNKKYQVIINLGVAFSLTYFYYAPNMVVLTIPYTTLNSPEKWGIFWHELASLLLDVIPADKSIKKIKPNPFLERIYKAKEHGFSLQNQTGQRLIQEFVTTNTVWVENIIPTVLKQSQITKGRFDDDNDAVYHQKIAKNWIEEIFEDAVSIWALDSDGFEVLVDVLNANYAHLPEEILQVFDKRHPPVYLRVKVAERLLALKGIEVENPYSSIHLDMDTIAPNIALALYNQFFKSGVIIATNDIESLDALLDEFKETPAESPQAKTLQGYLIKQLEAKRRTLEKDETKPAETKESDKKPKISMAKKISNIRESLQATSSLVPVSLPIITQIQPIKSLNDWIDVAFSYDDEVSKYCKNCKRNGCPKSCSSNCANCFGSQ